MSEKLLDLDDIDKLSPSQLTALQHAAAISPLITERTIGPLPPCDGATDKKKPKLTPPNKKNSPNTKQLERIAELNKSLPSRPIDEMGTLQCLDLNQISASVLLREAEQQRVKTVRQKAISMAIEKNSNGSLSLANAPLASGLSSEQWLEKRKLATANILRESEQQAADELGKSKMELETLRKQTERQLQSMAFDGVAKYQGLFRGKYEMVARLLMSIDKQMLMACGDYNSQLKDLIKTFDELLTKVKSGVCGLAEMTKAQHLCNSLDELERSILEDLEKLMKQEQTKAAEAYKLQEEAKKQAEVEERTRQDAEVAANKALQQQQQQEQQEQQQQQQQQEQQQQQQQPQTAPTEAAATAPAPTVASLNFVSAERDQFYNQINRMYLEKVERVKPLQADEHMQKYRSACQRAINIPVNAISAVSQQHLQDKFEKLYNFISGHPISTSDQGQISVNDHPVGRDFCLLLMAKKFVNQAVTTISSNPKAAFPVATVVVSLWKLVPDFGTVFLAYIYKESPLLLPHIMKQQPGQTPEDFYKSLGYRVDKGVVEPQNMYLKRQEGVARLYGAVMITRGRQMDGPSHPYGIEHGWRWLTNFVSLLPLPQVSETILLEMLQVIGSDMCSTYGRQFTKLLKHIQLVYMPKLTADDGGPKARLELLMAKCLQEGHIQKPQGMLPANFW